MGCLKLTYNEKINEFTEVSPLKLVYVNPELRQKNKPDFLEVGGILAQSGGTPDWVNITLGAASATTGYFQASYLNDAKHTYKYAQRVNGKVRSPGTITRANRISSLGSAKNLSRIGGGLTFLAAGATVYDGLTGETGWQNHHTADLAVSGAIYLTAASFPVVGWIAGGLYFAADLTTQYYTGKSITQNLFDP